MARRTSKLSSAETAVTGAAASRRLSAAAAAAGAAAMGNAAPGGEVAAAPAEAVPAASVLAVSASTPAMDIAAASATSDPDIAAVSATSDPDIAAASAAAAAVAAVSAAIAATAANKSTRSAVPQTSAPAPAPRAANPPVTVEGYVRAPGRENPSLIRARRDGAQAAAPALAASAPASAPAPDDPTRKYMRPAPDVPGITRAVRAADETPAEPARPAPLFSNEGSVRQYEGPQKSRLPGPVAGVSVALLAAGTALGHELGGAKTAITAGGSGRAHVTGGPALAPISGSPDFASHGNRRAGGRRRRVAAAMLLVGVLGTFVFATALSAALPPVPSDSVHSGSPGATSNSLIADATTLPNGSSAIDPTIEPTLDPTVDPTVDPSAVIVGDESLAPGATRRPTPKPTAKPTAVPTAVPTPVPTAKPSPTPVPTPVPTPIPAAPLIDTQEASPLAAGTPATFWVFYIPGSTCYITRTWTVVPHPAPLPQSPYSTSKNHPFSIQPDGKSGPIPWGANATYGVYSITATCTAPGGTAKTSPAITFEWTPPPTPTPAPTRTPTSH